MPPLKAFWRWPLGFQPPLDSTSLHSRSFTIVAGAAWRGISMGFGILDAETPCQHHPNISGKWGVPYK